MVQSFPRKDDRSPVLRMLTAGIFHFVKNCIHGPFAENVTELVKMWSFLKSVSPPSVDKKKTETGAAALYKENVCLPSCLHGKLTDRDSYKV